MAKKRSKKPKSTPPPVATATAPQQPTVPLPVTQPRTPTHKFMLGPDGMVRGYNGEIYRPEPPNTTVSPRQIILGCPPTLQEFFHMSEAELTSNGRPPTASTTPDFTLATEFPLAPPALRKHKRYHRIPLAEGTTVDHFIAAFTMEGYRMLDEYAAKYPDNKKLRELATAPRDFGFLYESVMSFGRSRGMSDYQIPSDLTKEQLQAIGKAKLEGPLADGAFRLGGATNETFTVGSEREADEIVERMAQRIGDTWEVKAVKYNPGDKMPGLPDGSPFALNDGTYEGGYSITFERRIPPEGSVNAPNPATQSPSPPLPATGTKAPITPTPQGTPVVAFSDLVNVPATGPTPRTTNKTSSPPVPKPQQPTSPGGTPVAPVQVYKGRRFYDGKAAILPINPKITPAPPPNTPNQPATEMKPKPKEANPTAASMVEKFKAGSMPSDRDDDLDITAGLAATHRLFMAEIAARFGSTPRELWRTLNGLQIAMRALAIAAHDGYQVYTTYSILDGTREGECLPFWEFMVKYERAIIFGALRFDDWRR